MDLMQMVDRGKGKLEMSNQGGAAIFKLDLPGVSLGENEYGGM